MSAHPETLWTTAGPKTEEKTLWHGESRQLASQRSLPVTGSGLQGSPAIGSGLQGSQASRPPLQWTGNSCSAHILPNTRPQTRADSLLHLPAKGLSSQQPSFSSPELILASLVLRGRTEIVCLGTRLQTRALALPHKTPQP